MLDRELREIKEQVMVPIAVPMADYATPTALSLVGLGFGIATGVAAGMGLYLPALLLWVINRVFDGLDGTIARMTDKQSDLGAYVDILADFAVYAFVPVMLAVGCGDAACYVAALFLLSTFYLNAGSWIYLTALLEKRQHQADNMTSVTMPRSLIEGGETVLFFTLFLLLPGHLVPLFALMGVLVLITVAQRFIWAVHVLAD